MTMILLVCIMCPASLQGLNLKTTNLCLQLHVRKSEFAMPEHPVVKGLCGDDKASLTLAWSNGSYTLSIGFNLQVRRQKDSVSHSVSQSDSQLVSQSLIQSLTHSITHPLTYSLTHSLTHCSLKLTCHETMMFHLIESIGTWQRLFYKTNKQTNKRRGGGEQTN